MIAIPTDFAGESHVEQTTVLDGRLYVLRFDWSQRDGHWSLSIADVNGVAIASGLSLVTDYPLLRGVSAEGRPTGELFVVDDNHEDPSFTSLGSSSALIYVPFAEIP